jgi:hypothetical protein
MYIPSGCCVLQSVICVIFLIAHVRHPVVFHFSGFDYFKLFWCAMLLWLVFHTFVLLAPGPWWTALSWRLVGVCADSILLTLPIWVVVIMISEMLFTYRNPGRRRVFFSRVTLFLFTATYWILGIIVSLSDVNTAQQTGDMVLFWRGVVLIAISIFVAMPAVRLHRAITYPVVQPEDRPCVKWSQVLIVLIVALGAARGIFELTTYPGWNMVMTWIDKAQDSAATSGTLSGRARAFLCCWEVFFGNLFSQLLIFAVLTLRAHEVQFDNDPIYRQGSDA